MGYVVDATGRKISLPRGASDAALAPYHVERSKLFVMDRLAGVEELDAERIVRAIGFTQFPYRRLTMGTISRRMARFCGLRILSVSSAIPIICESPMRYSMSSRRPGSTNNSAMSSRRTSSTNIPQFYWNSVFPHTQEGIRYLNVTSSGRQWIAGLYSNVFRAERDLHLSGPQP